MSSDREALIQVLEDARALLARPDNDFAWSSFRDLDEAVSEIDAHILAVRTGDQSKKRLDLQVLFAPTGPIQEVSLSSGWADQYLSLASRFDAVQTA